MLPYPVDSTQTLGYLHCSDLVLTRGGLVKAAEVRSYDSYTSHWHGDLGREVRTQLSPKDTTKDRGRSGKVSLCPVAKPGSGAGSYQHLSP